MKRINEKKKNCMDFLRRCFVALVPAKEKRAHEHADVEAYGCGGESIVIVTDAADVRVQVRPLLRTSDIHDALNGV